MTLLATTHALLGGPALALGVAAGGTAALASAVSYFISRLRLLVLSHALMGAVCIPGAWLLWPESLPPAPAWLVPMFGSATSYLCGQSLVFAALSRAKTSQVAPLLGLKIAMLAAIASMLPGEPLDLRQWIAVALSLVAAAMLQRGGGLQPAALALTLTACVTFAVADLFIVALIDGLQQTAAAAGSPLGRVRAGVLAMAVTYIVCGLLSAIVMLASRGRPTGRHDWRFAIRYAATWLVGMAALYFAYLLFFAGLDGVERKRVLALIVLFVACALFWSGFEQAGSSLNLFAERYTDRVVGAFTLPAGWFQSLNAIFIVIFAPVFSAIWVNLARRNLDPSTPVKFALGLIGMAIGFLMMFLAARVVADGLPAAAYWLVLTYLFHTFGELCLSPVGLSSVTKLVPHRFVGQSLGIWFLAVSLGNLVAGKIAGEFDADNVSAMPSQYLDIFWFGMVAAVVLFLLSPVVKRWMGGVK